MKKLPKCKEIPEDFWYPQGAREENLDVYRLLIHADAVCSDDFLSKYELDKRSGKDTSRLKDDDEYYGLSTLEDIEDAVKLLKKVMAKKQNLKGISRGTTLNGQTRKTPRSILQSHVTWWPYLDTNPLSQFSIIAGGEENE